MTLPEFADSLDTGKFGFLGKYFDSNVAIYGLVNHCIDENTNIRIDTAKSNNIYKYRIISDNHEMYNGLMDFNNLYIHSLSHRYKVTTKLNRRGDELIVTLLDSI